MIFVVVDWHSIHGTLLGLSSRHLPSSGLTNPNPLNALFLRHFAPVQSFSLCDLLCRSGLSPPLVFLFVGETLLSSAGFLCVTMLFHSVNPVLWESKGLLQGFLVSYGPSLRVQLVPRLCELYCFYSGDYCSLWSFWQFCGECW